MLPFLPYELSLSAALQGDGSWQQCMLWMSYLGSEAFVFALPFVYLVLSKAAGARLYLLFSLSGVLLYCLKLGFHSPRPCWLGSEVRALTPWGGYGLPSGHVVAASIVWPLIAKTVAKPWAWPVAIISILLVSVSRIYLGVHFLCDTIAAWAIGAGLLCAFFRCEKGWSKRFGSLTLGLRLLLALWATTLLAAIGFTVHSVLGHVPDPPTYAAFSGSCRGLGGLFQPCGEFLGAACGIVLAQRWASFEVAGPISKRLAALAYALLGAWLLRQLPGLIPAPLTEPLQFAINFFQGTVANLWILFIAPRILLRMRLLESTGVSGGCGG
jgi:membrane-associated phospholipid phosphatase